MYRAEGMPPERALALTTKDTDNQYNPAIEAGVDNILFGKKSLTSAIGQGIKDAAYSGFKTVYDDTQKYGAGFALLKSPLSVVAGVGRGVGDVVGGVLETADDLVGESVSQTATNMFGPVVDEAINSDVGQYLIEGAKKVDEVGRGVPSDILDSLNLLGLGGVVKSSLPNTIKNTVLNSADDVFKGAVQTKTSLSDFFKKPSTVTPEAEKITSSVTNIQNTINQSFKNTVTGFDDTAIVGSLDDILSEIKTQGVAGEDFGARILTKLDEVIQEKSNGTKTIADLTVDEKTAIDTSIKDIEDLLNQADAPSVVESYLTAGKNRIDKVAASGVNIVERLSDEFIEGGIKTIENVKAIPEAISVRAKQAIDRRIVRIAKNDPTLASDKILDLYKRAVVPGVKKKNKTIANIEQIDESIKRAVPDLAKKYDVEDLQDFAGAISLEKKAIFKEIEKGLVAAGDEGRVIDMTPIVKELDALLASERADFSQPLKNAIARARKELVTEGADGSETIKSISPSGAQDLIADLNSQLQSYYRGSTPGTAADVTVDNLVVNQLRTQVDAVVDDLGEGSFKELKSRYADLKRMEDDVVHRAVFEAQKGEGLGQLTDISSAGDIMAGALSPAFLAKGVTQFFTKEVLKSLNDKDELIRQMFLYGKNLDSI